MMTAQRLPAYPWFAALLVLAATFLAAMAAQLLSVVRGKDWFLSLPQSPLTPPAWAYTLVLPLLFALMAAGALIVLARARSFESASGALGVYFAMLAAIVSWSLFFFFFRKIDISLGAAAALLLLIWAGVAEFFRYSRTAAVLLLPGFAWVCFAFYLNAFIWLNGRGL